MLSMETNGAKYNSQALKEEFKEVYKDFFSTCNTVVSAPGSFLWAGNYGLLFGGLGVTQNVPLRVYVGLEEASGGQITFGKCLSFEPLSRRFIFYEVNSAVREELAFFLKKELTDNLGGQKFKGLKINLLSEMLIGYGINASGALAASLASALFLHFQRINPATLSDFSMTKTEELLNHQLFNQLFRLAWKIEAIFNGGLASGVGAFAPFIASHGPIVYFIDSFCTKKKNFSLIDKLNYVAFRLSELGKDSSDYFFPFDFGLINPGTANVSTIADLSLSNFENQLSETFHFYQKELKNFLNQSHFKLRPAYNEDFARGSIHSILSSFLNIVSLLSMNVLFSLHCLNQRFFSSVDFIRLRKNLNNYQNIYQIISSLSPFAKRLFNLLEEKSQIFNDEFGIGFKLTNHIQGGYIAFIISSQRSQKNIFKVIEEIRQTLDKNITIDWVSWRDGLESRGLVVEQSIVNGLYSNFISRGALQILHLDKWGLHEDLYTLEEFSRAKKEMEVVLDFLNGEIWIKGEKITSKELRTSIHTISALRVLLENIKTEIPKTKLPASGYLKDRNEFQSKIATPLVKAIEKYLDRRISFNVKGPIINFTVNFDPKDVEFYYIEKEF